MSAAIRVAIDAGNLVRDGRGMGRVARGVVRALAADPAFAPELLARGDADLRALRAEFPELPAASTREAGRRGRFDVAWYPFNGMRERPAAPALVTMHDAFAFTEPHAERVARAREQRPIRRAARCAARIVTVSAWSRGELARALRIDAARIAVVANVPSGFWSPGAAEGLPASLRGVRYALVAGSREPRKNVALALDAAARSLRADEALVVVGGLAAAQRERARARGLRPLELAPDDATLRALYRAAGAVLVPSLAEGFGLVAVEAMACGAPVLAAAASALPEATGGGATLLDPRDAPAWAAAIRALFDDASAAAAARDRALARSAEIDRSAHARGTIDLLRDVVAR